MALLDTISKAWDDVVGIFVDDGEDEGEAEFTLIRESQAAEAERADAIAPATSVSGLADQALRFAPLLIGGLILFLVLKKL